MGTSISAGTIMAYMDLDMSSFNSAIDMAGEQLSGFASGGVAGALGSIGCGGGNGRARADTGRYCAIDDSSGRGDSNRHAI